MSRINRDRYFENISNAYGDKVEILSEFNGKERPITICYHCEKHGDTIKTLNAKNVLNKNFNPCKKCLTEKKSVSRTNDKKLLYQRLVDYCNSRGGSVIETEWITAKTIYHFKCSNSDHPVFTSTADSLVSNSHWCPWCSGRSGNFEKEIDDIILSKGGIKIGKYINASTPIRIKCIKHDYEWDMTPCNIKKDRWCPICKMGLSEKAVWDWYKERNINIIPQYTFEDLSGELNNKYRFDFAVLSESNDVEYLLEIDDESHRGNSNKYAHVRESDKLKNSYCELHDIKLIRIPISYSKLRVMPEEWYRTFISKKLSEALGVA